MKSAATAPTALLLIDIQYGFDHPTHWGGARNNAAFEDNVSKLLGASRRFSQENASSPILIIHVHHHSTQPESMLHPTASITPANSPAAAPVRAVDPQPYAAPLAGEAVFTKSVNDSFTGSQLEAYLRENHVRQLLVVGLTTDHCVSTTTRMAANRKVLGNDGGVDGSGPGHGVLLVADATATFGKAGFDAETLHRAHLASLDAEFCRVVTAREVLADVLGLVAA